MKNLFLVVSTLSILTFSAIAGADQDPNVTPELVEKLKDVYARSKSPETSAFIQGGNSFGLKLFQMGYQTDPTANRIYSPSSLATNMSIVANMAKPENQSVIFGKLGWSDLTIEQINASNKVFTDFAKMYHRSYSLELANGIWIDPELQVPQTLQTQIVENYDGEFRTEDFKAPTTAEKINSWVSEKTKGNIKEIVNADALKPNNVFIVNAMHFDATWRVPFLSRQGRMKFQTPTGEVETEYMSAADELPTRIIRTDEYDVVALPYAYGATTEAFGDKAHGQATMMVFLPKEGYELKDLIGLITAEQVEAWSETFKTSGNSWFSFTMPKFKLSFQDKDYPKHLESLGLGNLTKEVDIATSAQKAYIEVAEKGTVAGVVTAMGMSVASSVPPFSIKVDRPFVYLLKDAATGAILFVGVVNDPTKTE